MGDSTKGDMSKVAARRKAPLETPTDLESNAVNDISAALTSLLADTFALYVKTKNFHWHMSAARTSATITCCSTSRPTRSSP